MQIDDTLLAKLEKLAMIEVGEDKKESIKAQLQEIMDFVGNLEKLDTTELQATFNVLESATPLREDVPACDEGIGQSILSHAPKAQEDYFIVPKIL
ncbi:MAG: Asp-tRNA(Asn)/Glu-tRNA(Gln) amidotransferase subunit GatC [Helicobacter sp.]|nr:Asp-tRNA(Asn)/Glu-tRNA(Gln) amidotransferase subunit GatC [Helicobacter sp.]